MNQALMIAMLLTSATFYQSSATPVPKVSSSPLTSEQGEVYRDFLIDYKTRSKNGLNLADLSFILQPDEGDYSGCMQGFPQSSVPTEVHRFDEKFGQSNHVRIVDPQKHKIKDPGDSIRNGQSVESAVQEGFANGVLSLSEVIFDSTHQRAALRYSFYCGRLCAQSETVVMEKHNGAWKRAKGSC
jgi:hypothetical protein